MKCSMCGNLAKFKAYFEQVGKTTVKFICEQCAKKVAKQAEIVDL